MMASSYPYRRYNFPTWHEIGVLEEAMKEVKRSPLPFDLSNENIDKVENIKQTSELASSLSSAFNILGGWEETRKFSINIPIRKLIESENIDPVVSVTCQPNRQEEEDVVILHKDEDKENGIYREVVKSLSQKCQNVDMSSVKSVDTPEGFLTFEIDEDYQDELQYELDFDSLDE